MKHNFRELHIWQESKSNAIFTYKHTKEFPKEELFGLTSQMRRAAVSIASNIAEGCGRDTDVQLGHFLAIASGSACELETQILIAYELGYLTEQVMQEWLNNLNSLQRRVRSFRHKILGN